MSIDKRIKKFILKTPAVKNYLSKKIHEAGYDIKKGINPTSALFNNYGIDLIFDIGANRGQFAKRTRAAGYKGRIVSFEPLSSVFEKLKAVAQQDPLMTALNYGCGDFDGPATINISTDTVFSSLLNQLPMLNENFTKSNYIGKEEIKVVKLDSVFDQYYKKGDKVLIKIDTQGFEKKVLEGAMASLKKTTALELELSTVPHYEGEVLIKEMLDFMFAQGFTLVSLELLQNNLKQQKLNKADGIFFKLP